MSVPPFGDFADATALADLAASAEAAGWDGFFIWDHVMFDPTFHPILNPWIGLAVVALRTSRIRIGTMVTPLARRRPWQVARETVALDRLSGGRLTLGVGLGDPKQWDYGFFGEETDARIRADKLDESLEIITGLWTGESYDFQGTHYSLEPVTFRPTPAQQPRIPIWVGSWWPNKRPLRRAARFDGMVPIKWGEPMSIDELRAAVDYVAAHRTSEQPFDVVMSGASDPTQRSDAERVAGYARAGATWWVEDISPWRFGADYERSWTAEDTANMRERVLGGPPR